MSDDKVFTLRELMEYLRISRITALRFIKKGKINAAKVGREWRILKSEVDKYLRGENK